MEYTHIPEETVELIRNTFYEIHMSFPLVERATEKIELAINDLNELPILPKHECELRISSESHKVHIQLSAQSIHLESRHDENSADFGYGKTGYYKTFFPDGKIMDESVIDDKKLNSLINEMLAGDGIDIQVY